MNTCYTQCMGIGKRSDGSFYIRCDWDDCGHKIDLEAKDFWEASAEAKRLGWTVCKTPDGWKNFHTRFCELCYFAPQKIVRRKVTCDTSDTQVELKSR